MGLQSFLLYNLMLQLDRLATRMRVEVKVRLLVHPKRLSLLCDLK